MKFTAVLLLLGLLFLPRSVYAVESPLDTPNNRFGIHVMSEADFPDAAELVNSSGGKWGYVTFVIREDERNSERWQKAFAKLEEYKLIPIVRVATAMEGESWKRPDQSEAGSWASFLDSLPWPTKNRYVILFNEPNHAKEWGGELDPEGYAVTVRKYWEQLKRRSPNFFVLPAGYDLAAPNSADTMDVSLFWERMYQKDELIFTIFDGWTSHSYPNPGFSGYPDESGRTSIRGYKWELARLAPYGLIENAPVFITETGWATGRKISKSIAGDYYISGFTEAWNDPGVVAVTPFILSYDSPPFNIFSWKLNGEYGDAYHSIRSLPKIEGSPALPDPVKLTLEQETRDPRQLIESMLNPLILFRNSATSSFLAAFMLH